MNQRRLLQSIFILSLIWSDSPIYNTDSNDKFGTDNRPSQEGSPIETGLRQNSQGLDLNRDGIKMDIANKHAGVSCNDLTDELALDALSGNAAVNGVAVTICKSMAKAAI